MLSETVYGRFMRRIRCDNIGSDALSRFPKFGEERGIKSLEELNPEPTDEMRRRLILGDLPSGGRGKSSFIDAVRKTLGLEIFWFIPPAEMDRPLSSLHLIVPVARKRAREQGLTLVQSQRNTLESLELDGGFFDYDGEQFRAICNLADVSPTFDGLCEMTSATLLTCAIMLGAGIASDRAVGQRLPVSEHNEQSWIGAAELFRRLAPGPSPWLIHQVFTEGKAIGELPVKMSVVPNADRAVITSAAP